MKKIAFYLPQFHTIPENDQWWGKGFTEWTNIRNSKPQYCGHRQPEVPLNDNYYDLMDDAIQEWQSRLASEYGIDAFCYYHYWFEGKMLLEKPMEKMLLNKSIKIQYCICWANETWSRTWDGKETSILIKQNYTEGEDAWKKHFNYFCPFFKDERYLKLNNKPVLIIYKPHLITNCEKMLSFWNQLAKQEGFDGLYLGYQHNSAFDFDMEKLGFDFGIEFEPFYTVRELEREKRKSTLGFLKRTITHPTWIYNLIEVKVLKKPKKYTYDEIWKRILTRKRKENIMPGAFVAWDNTPRMKNKSTLFTGSTPKKFARYFSKLYNFAVDNNKQFLFINAWNEWAEGAHLEPDIHNGYGYLEGIRSSEK